MTLMCPITEARILAACLIRRDIFDYLADLAVEHFTVPQHRIAWMAMRNLQAEGQPIGVIEICDYLEMRDLEDGTHLSDSVNAGWLGALVCTTHDYTEERLFDRDVEWLQTLAERRVAI